MNIRSIYLAGLFAIIGSHIINTNAQQLRNPFDFPILLSGNFGELRSNHFHSGICFCEYEDRLRFGIVKSEMRFPFASALAFRYLCLKQK